MTGDSVLSPFLRQLICCPDCGGELSTSSRLDNSLQCEGCQGSFPVEEGIPLLFSQKIQQETVYKTYVEQYKEHERDIHEGDSPIIGYLNMNLLEKLKYHLLQGPSSLRRRKLARKMKGRFMSLARFVGPTEGLTILDVGAREGLLLGLLKGNKVAFDLSPFHLKCAQERGSSAVAGFAERLPFKDDSFDVVVCSEVFEHVLRPGVIAAEITRVLRPTGRAIIETPFGEVEEHLFEIRENSGKMASKHSFQRSRKRPPTLHLRNFKDENELKTFFPSLKARRKGFYFYKRRRDLPGWVRKLLGPFRRLPDTFKRPFPSLFAPSMFHVEFVSESWYSKPG